MRNFAVLFIFLACVVHGAHAQTLVHTGHDHQIPECQDVGNCAEKSRDSVKLLQRRIKVGKDIASPSAPTTENDQLEAEPPMEDGGTTPGDADSDADSDGYGGSDGDSGYGDTGVGDDSAAGEGEAADGGGRATIPGMFSAAVESVALQESTGVVNCLLDTFQAPVEKVPLGMNKTSNYEIKQGQIRYACAVVKTTPPLVYKEVGAVACSRSRARSRSRSRSRSRLALASRERSRSRSSKCSLCFGGVYATMDSAGLSKTLKKFIGISPIESFALFSNIKASFALMSKDLVGSRMQALPAPLNKGFVQGINVFGTIRQPKSCKALGVRDIICEIMKPMWKKLPNGIHMYSQISVESVAPCAVTKTSIGVKITGIPLAGKTVINEMDLKYSLISPTKGSTAPPSTTVAGALEIGTEIDGQPLILIGTLKIGLEATKTTFVGSVSMPGIVALPTPIIGLFSISIYDLVCKMGLAITPVGPILEDFLIGGGLCLGSRSNCEKNYKKVGNLDTVVMGAMYLGMKMKVTPTFGISIQASPISLKKLLSVINLKALASVIPSLISNAALTGYEDCTDSSNMKCWIVLQANVGFDPLTFDFADNGGPSLTINPGVLISAGIKFGGAHGGLYVEGDGTFLKMRLKMTPLSLFGGQMKLSRSRFSSSGGQGGGSKLGPFVKLDVNILSKPPKAKCEFSARMQLWSFLDASAYLRMEPGLLHVLVTGFPMFLAGALTADAFLVQEVERGVLKLGILIHTAKVAEALAKFSALVKKLMNNIRNLCDTINKGASDIMAAMNKRFDVFNDKLNKAKRKFDAAVGKLNRANRKLTAQQNKCNRIGRELLELDSNGTESGGSEISDAYFAEGNTSVEEDWEHEEESLLSKGSVQDSYHERNVQSSGWGRRRRRWFNWARWAARRAAAAAAAARRAAVAAARRAAARARAIARRMREAALAAARFACKRVFDVAKVAVNVAKGTVKAAKAGVSAFQWLMDKLKKFINLALKVVKWIVTFAGKIANAVGSAISVLAKYKLLGIGFKGNFKIGESFNARVSVSMFYSTNGKTAEAGQIGAKFYPSEFTVPDEAKGGFHLAVTPKASSKTECLKKSAKQSVARNGAGNQALAVTCCDSHGKGSRPTCAKSRTWNSAKDLCESKGLSLCTKAQISQGAGVGSACGFDNYFNWVSDTCQAKISANLAKKTFSLSLKISLKAIAQAILKALFAAVIALKKKVEGWFKDMGNKFKSLKNIRKTFDKLKVR